MPRKRTSKITAKRFSHDPSTIKTRVAKAATPAVVVTPAPVVETQENVVAITAAVAVAESTPVIATTSITTSVVESAFIAVTAATTTEESTAPVMAAMLAIDSPDADIARDAATALGSLGDTSAVELLVDVLNNANGYFHSVVRAAAAASLGQLGDVRALEPLLGALNDPIAEVSSESIRALAALGDARAVDALIDVVRNRCGYFLPTTRQAAILALAKLGGDRATSELQTVADNSCEEPAIRIAAETGIVLGTVTISI